MKANINEAELSLLAYLHEHARGFNEHYLSVTKIIQTDLELSDAQLHFQSSYLAAHGLVGVNATFVGSLGDQHPVIRGLWITGLGEDYMRELEAAPGVGKKLGAGMVREMGAALRTIAVAVLSDFLKRHV
jgi:hypothetical protein